MQGRTLFLGVVLGLAALAALARGAFAPGPPAPGPQAWRAEALASPFSRGARLGGSASEAGPRVEVYVAGEVARPGVYRLPAGERAQAALRAAGGATANADLVAVNLAARLEDGEEIAVPERGASRSGAASVARKHRAGGARVSRSRHQRRGAARGADAATPVDINAADERQLRTLPGVDANLADRIVAFRLENGPFQTIDDLRDVAGVTDGKLARMEPYLIVP